MHTKSFLFLILAGFIGSCSTPQGASAEEPKTNSPQFELTLSSPTASQKAQKLENGNWELQPGGFLALNVAVTKAGRYKIEAWGQSDSGQIWLEDYYNNQDGRAYNITGNLAFTDGKATVWGSPLDTGTHPLKIHALHAKVQLERVQLTLVQPHRTTPQVHKQKMLDTASGWELVWSDEFEDSGAVDTSKWSFNVGNWGWGNNEPQFYTQNRLKNARQQDGNLIIEAHKNDSGFAWTSARLTTQGKHAFLYGKIDFRARVPEGRGTWAAGWLLGDAYRDEISWPYCGEIDVLETVGYEINDTTGAGKNHASCHTPAYYFKKNNHITGTIALDSMNTKFHTYSVEWYPDSVIALLDGVHYYTYDKTANDLEWPFDQPQNIILNLAVGGGWGGAKGIDPTYQKHRYVIDYVRVYQKKS